MIVYESILQEVIPQEINLVEVILVEDIPLKIVPQQDIPLKVESFPLEISPVEGYAGQVSLFSLLRGLLILSPCDLKMWLQAWRCTKRHRKKP